MGRKMVSLILACVLLATSLLMVSQAQAHGAMFDPISRVYACYLEGPETPDSMACRDAIASGGTQPLYDWNEVHLLNAAGNHRGLIPDGKLCSAGQAKYAAFDQPRTDWATTVMPTSGDYTFRYSAFVPHNHGYFELYITRNGYDPTQPLKWSDLEDTPFLRADMPPVVDGYYVMTGPLPSGKTGRHLIYAIWQRNDSPEAFYTCSDVWFGSPGSLPTPTPPPACTAPIWNATTVYATDAVVAYNGREWRARWSTSGQAPSSDGASNAWELVRFCQIGSGTPVPTTPPTAIPPTPTNTPTSQLPTTTPRTPTVTIVPPTSTNTPPTATAVPPTPTNGPGGTCQIDYTVNQWSNGFTGYVKVINLGPSISNGWTLTWTFGGNQQIIDQSAWNAVITQTGASVKATSSAIWNASIPSNGSVSFGFQANYTGVNAIPANFVLNGLPCNGVTATPTSLPPTATRTAVPPTVTGVPPTPTRTTIPPTVTGVPPTPTRTTIPPTATSLPPTPTNGSASCVVNYAVNQWNNAFTAEVKVTNNGAPLSNWTLVWQFAGDQQVTSAWNAVVTQSGKQVTVKPSADWNTTLPTGGSQSFGFQASYSGTNSKPSSFTLNGASCSVAP